MHPYRRDTRQMRGVKREYYAQGQENRNYKHPPYRKAPKYQEELNWRIRLCRELEDTRRQLARQKALKELYVNKVRETQLELERLQRCNGAQALNATWTLNQGSWTNRQRTKDLEHNAVHRVSKPPQERVETVVVSNPEVGQRCEDPQRVIDLQGDLDVAHVVSAGTVATKMQPDPHLVSERKLQSGKTDEREKSKCGREKNNGLQEELEQLRALYQKILKVSQPAERENVKSDPEQDTTTQVDSVKGSAPELED